MCFVVVFFTKLNSSKIIQLETILLRSAMVLAIGINNNGLLIEGQQGVVYDRFGSNFILL